MPAAVAAVDSMAADDTAFRRALRPVRSAERSARYIIVNLAARRLWYVDGDSVRYAASVAVGKGTRRDPDAAPGEFATPRARFVVLRRDSLPLWVPPDWHFEEAAARTGRALYYLGRGETLRARDGATYFVANGDVVRRAPDGALDRVVLTDSLGRRRELVVDGHVVVPPIGTAQRAYPQVLGARRLAFRDGYAIHGTDKPESVGRAASHGCLRMHNAEVTALFALVPVGTPVYLQ